MFRDHDRIDVTELETNAVEMLLQVLEVLDTEFVSSKQNAMGQCKKMCEDYEKRLGNSCELGEPNTAVYNTIQRFYRQIINDLTEIQKLCAEYKIHEQLDLGKESDLRQKPVGYKEYIKDLKKIGRCWKPPDEDEGESIGEPKTYQACNCKWTNVPESELEPTQDILKRPIVPRKTAFDLSDLRFKQEMTVLRTKLFTLPEMIPKRRRMSGFDRASSLLAGIKSMGSKIEFKDSSEESAPWTIASVEEEAARIGSLKFVDGQFTHCELWRKLLDVSGNQLRSKWLLVLCPQMEARLKKHIVPSAHFSPKKVFALLSRIPENGSKYTLSKEEMIHMLHDESEVAEWLYGWKVQFKLLAGIQIAATTIQRYWRGYAVRREIRKSECRYVAASIIWMAWMCVKKRRDMHAKYLKKMLVTLNETEELNAKLAADYYEIVKEAHVVIHLPSIGHPPDVRNSISPPIFRIYQNILALKMSFLKNRHAEVIYILPVEPSDSLLRMYFDILESVRPNEGIQNRVTFLALSMRRAFDQCSFNTARTLYYSNTTVTALKQAIAGKPAYLLPWVMDECDVWAAGTLRVPWLGSSMSLQSRLFNKSANAELLTSLGIDQPPYSPYVKDYTTLCTKLADLICMHSEVCLWLIKLNVGIDGNQTGVFLINNVSVPFMLELRNERMKCGEAWTTTEELRKPYLDLLLEHLPKVVFTLTRLAPNYKCWKDFYGSLTKHGCLLQAVPDKKTYSILSAAIFIPGLQSRRKPVWVGTADQMHLETQFTAFGFMIPQTSFPHEKLRTVVTTLAEALQEMGYFGYASFDLFCYVRKFDDVPVALILDLDAYYGKVHNFLDWFSFTINGKYDPEKNIFQSDVNVSSQARKKFRHPQSRIVLWDETKERFGIAMGRLHHTELYRHRWPKLYYFCKKCKVRAIRSFTLPFSSSFTTRLLASETSPSSRSPTTRKRELDRTFFSTTEKVALT
ncbi:IQ motif-containing protein H-like [Neodiprion fabricii]|uniref:IQ motif-containing protein H-like n=1 Tax=Neodiprion fabricii TaxID=2872261 RepID=UPI001ED8FB6C|nr:IQ motif-containing protein H-like [Neodiprion fabricii]